MENEGDRPARGKSRKPKERSAESTSSKRPPVLLNEEDVGLEKLSAPKSKAKASRRTEREPSPDQEEDVIDGFVIASFRSEDSLKNALKKHSNVYENRMLQLPVTRGHTGGTAARGPAAAVDASRICGAHLALPCIITESAPPETPKPCTTKVGGGGSSLSGKGKENKDSGSASHVAEPDPSRPAASGTQTEQRLFSSFGSPAPPTCNGSPAPAACNGSAETSIIKADSWKKGERPPCSGGALTACADASTLSASIASPSKASGNDTYSLPSDVLAKGIGKSEPSSTAPPQLSTAVNTAKENTASTAGERRTTSSAGDLPASASSACTEGTSGRRSRLPANCSHTPHSTDQPASSSGTSTSTSSGREPKHSRVTDSATSSTATAAKSSPWSSSRCGDNKAQPQPIPTCAHLTASPSAAATSWHAGAADGGIVTAVTSSPMNSSQPFYAAAAYSNPLAAMLGMAATPPGAGGGGGAHPVMGVPNFMTNAAIAAAAVGLPVMGPAYGPEFSAYHSQDIQRELSCRFLESQMERSALAAAALPSYLHSGGAGASSAQQHQHLYNQFLQTAAAAAQQQHQAAVAAAAGVPPLPLHYGSSLVPTPAPHVYGGKASKLDAMALWGQAMPATFPPALTAAAAAAAAAAMHATTSTGPSPFQSIAGGAGSLMGDTSASFTTKKSGRWCAAHVKIAWQIFSCQQKSKLEQSGGPMSSLGGSLASLVNVKNEAAAGAARPPAAAASHDSPYRSGSSMSSLQSTGTPPMNCAARSPHSSSLNYSPVGPYPAMSASRDLADWSARLGGAAALLSLGPAALGWPNLRAAEAAAAEQRPNEVSGATAAAGDRQGSMTGYDRGANSTEGRESRSGHAGGSKEHRSLVQRPRSRSPVRARSREAAADKMRVKAEHKDDDGCRSVDRLARSNAVAEVLPNTAQQQQPQQQVGPLFNPMLDVFGNQKWIAGLFPPVATTNVGAGTPLLTDRRLWSPFERSAESGHRSHAAEGSANQDSDQRQNDRPLMDYRLAAAAAAAERTAQFPSGSKLKLSASSPYLSAGGGSLPTLTHTVHPSAAVNGRCSTAPVQISGGTATHDKPSSPATIVGGATVCAVNAAVHHPRKISSPGRAPAAPQTTNSAASADSTPASENEAHSR